MVEVSDEVGEIIMESRRKEHADDERHRYHAAYSIDGANYEDEAWADYDTPERQLIAELDEQLRRDRIDALWDQLTPRQARRLRFRAKGLTYAQIAEIEGCSENSAYLSVQQAINFSKNFLKGF